MQVIPLRPLTTPIPSLENGAHRSERPPSSGQQGITVTPAAFTDGTGTKSPLPPRRGIAGFASAFWKECDLRTMFQQHGDDAQLLTQFRAQHLDSIRHQLQELKPVLESEAISPRLRKARLAQVAEIERQLLALSRDRVLDWTHALKLAVNMTWLWPALVPSPLLAGQAKTFAYTTSAVAKGVAAVAGSTTRPTADGPPCPFGRGELGHHANEVHLYPALLNFVYGSLYGAKKFGKGTAAGETADRLEHTVWFHLLMAVSCGAAMTPPFIGKPLGRAWHRASGSLATHTSGLPTPLRKAADWVLSPPSPEAVPPEARDSLSGLASALQARAEGVREMRADFTQSGGELTRTVNSQMTRLAGEIQDLADRISVDTGRARSAFSEGLHGGETSNDDRGSKLALTVFAGLVCAATVALIQPDVIGTVDLIADAIVVITAMVACLLDASATRQDAIERFKGMCSTSLIMVPALGLDKVIEAATGTGLIDRSAESPYIAAALMALMACTLPGPTARGMELGLNALFHQIESMKARFAVEPEPHEDIEMGVRSHPG